MDKILEELIQEIRRLRMISIPVDLLEQVTIPVYTAAVNLEDILERLKGLENSPEDSPEEEPEECEQDVGD